MAKSLKSTIPYDGKVVFPSGATRSNDRSDTRFDLVCPTGHHRLAKRCALGAIIHGERNWTKGMPIPDILNHMERHLAIWKGGDRSEDHLAAIAWGVFAIMHFEDKCMCGVTGTAYDQMLTDYMQAEQEKYRGTR